MITSKRITGFSILLLASNLRPQEEAKTPKIDSASVEAQGERCRVTLRGKAQGPEGSMVLVKALPRIYQLGGDGESLLPSVCQMTSASCRAELRGAAFTATLAPSWLLEHEVQTSVPGPSGPTASTQVLVFYEVAWLNRRLRQEAQTLLRLRQTIGEFVGQVEPHERSGALVSPKLAKRLREINDQAASWAESTPLAASASVLIQVIHELWMSVPWGEPPASGKGADAEAGGVREGYEPAGRPSGPMETAKWTRRLRGAARVALREEILATLACLEEWGARAERPGWSGAAARSELKVLERLIDWLQTGDLADAAYTPGSELKDLLATALETAGTLPDRGAPEGPVLERVRDLVKRARGLRLKTMAPAP